MPKCKSHRNLTRCNNCGCQEQAAFDQLLGEGWPQKRLVSVQAPHPVLHVQPVCAFAQIVGFSIRAANARTDIYFPQSPGSGYPLTCPKSFQQRSLEGPPGAQMLWWPLLVGTLIFKSLLPCLEAPDYILPSYLVFRSQALPFSQKECRVTYLHTLTKEKSFSVSYLA